MKTVATFCVIVCILYKIILVVGDDQVEGQSVQSRRTARDVTDPAAIDCKMSPWTEWSNCDPCSKIMFRSRSVEVFGQFKGLACTQPLGDRKPCRTDQACEEELPPQCSSTEFECESGTCIKKRLVCNGDNDCGDFSDEDCEQDPRRPCGNQDLQLSELGRTAGYGINVLGSEPRSNAFNNDFFNGLCTRVRDPSTLEYHRVPWNVATLNYATISEESFSKEIYEDTSSLLKEILEERKSSLSLGLSFKFKPTELSLSPNSTANANIDLQYGHSDSIKKITEYSSTKNRSFMRVKGKVQLSTFRMRSRDQMTTETFLDDVKYLPVEYAKGEYFRFMEDYGTHYAASGKEGGEYELVYVLNKDTLKTKKLTERNIQDCLTLDMSIDFQGTPSLEKAKAHVKPGFCDDVKTSEDGQGDGKALIDKVVTAVKGGTIQTATRFRTQIQRDGVLDVETYVQWAKSLEVAPVLINNQPEAIHSLIPLKMPHAEAKRENLQRAIEDYIAEYSVCKCQPCHNGGTITLIDGLCHCLCPPEFEGLACQTIKSDLLKERGEPIPQEGNWGCWSAWSSCSGGRRSRTRSCNTQGLTGASCKGETLSTDYC
ncbi:complement component C9 [Megalops cyprinoides]|uniref:complement component C9 n=1 Tax=Megalops cyprinoides TaxID=118141 RepID=UPI001863C0E2|nr:complement component C9 [Megalops cyprinoides]